MEIIIDRQKFSEIQEICHQYEIERYTINNDGSIDVNGPVNISDFNLTELPLTFNKVEGYFVCSDNNLTSLKGAPKYVGGKFDASSNELTSLEHMPVEIGGRINININKLISLIGAPEISFENFSCDYNELTSLEGCPKVVDVLDCSHNKINTFHFFPDKIGLLFFDNNNLDEYFMEQMKTLSYTEYHSFLKYVKYYDCWNPELDVEKLDGFLLDLKEGLE